MAGQGLSSSLYYLHISPQFGLDMFFFKGLSHKDANIIDIYIACFSYCRPYDRGLYFIHRISPDSNIASENDEVKGGRVL